MRRSSSRRKIENLKSVNPNLNHRMRALEKKASEEYIFAGDGT